MDGILNIYKETGYTSHDVVAKLRGILRQRKIGHTGTLDPDASGVLPVCLGSATKLCGMLTDRKKSYRAVMRLGIVTDTQDMTGTVLRENPVAATAEEVRAAVLHFVGGYGQVPPMYSALKVNGKKLYELAREGKEIERQARQVEIDEIIIEETAIPLVRFVVKCGKGTYIRALCQDIGERLGCGACMESLERLTAAGFSSETALRLSQVEQLWKEGKLEPYIVPTDAVFAELPACRTRRETDRLAQNGNKLEDRDFQEKAPAAGRIRVYDSGQSFIGVYGREDKGESWKPVQMFLGSGQK